MYTETPDNTQDGRCTRLFRNDRNQAPRISREFEVIGGRQNT